MVNPGKDSGENSGDGGNLAPSTNRFALRSPKEALQPVAAPAPPPKRRRKNGFLGKISGIFSLLVFLGIGGAGIAFYAKTQLNEKGPLQADKVVLIPKGSPNDDIVEQLARENVISHPGFMSAYMMVSRAKPRAGEYLIKKEASISEIVKTLESGKAIVHKITIPEGLTSEQIVERVIENDILSGEIKDTPREGTLLPDTYTFERGYSREQMLKSMRAAQDKLLKDVWARRAPDVPVKTPLEMVTLASIVEKETGKSEERPRVAAVFVNRLNKDMRLQTDPTVIYGIVGGKGSLGRALTRSDLDTPTPFNTYTIKGLPPGPIANPGKAALEAVANPLKSRELFFVADGTGGHAFAETNDQHSRNVARWRQIEQQSKDNTPAYSAPAPVAPPAILPGSPPASGIIPAPALPPGIRSELNVPMLPKLAVQSPALPRSSFAVQPMPNIVIPGVNDAPVADLNKVAPENYEEMTPVGGALASYPVPASRRTGSKRQPGAAPRSDDPSADDNTQQPPPALAYQAQPESAQAGPRPRAFDAVAGTPKDPLLNTTYDLNSPKIVPKLR